MKDCLILIEGMQYKIPIISTKCQSGSNEILKKGKYGYLTEIDNEYDVDDWFLGFDVSQTISPLNFTI